MVVDRYYDFFTVVRMESAKNDVGNRILGKNFDVSETVGSCFNRIVECVKGVGPRVMVGWVISESMKVVSAKGFGGQSDVAKAIAFTFIGFVAGGGFLGIAGVLCGGADCGRYGNDVETSKVCSRRYASYSLILGIVMMLIGVVGGIMTALMAK